MFFVKPVLVFVSLLWNHAFFCKKMNRSPVFYVSLQPNYIGITCRILETLPL